MSVRSKPTTSDYRCGWDRTFCSAGSCPSKYASDVFGDDVVSTGDPDGSEPLLPSEPCRTCINWNNDIAECDLIDTTGPDDHGECHDFECGE